MRRKHSIHFEDGGHGGGSGERSEKDSELSRIESAHEAALILLDRVADRIKKESVDQDIEANFDEINKLSDRLLRVIKNVQVSPMELIDCPDDVNSLEVLVGKLEAQEAPKNVEHDIDMLNGERGALESKEGQPYPEDKNPSSTEETGEKSNP
ncbi:hypothetical protein ACFLZS_01145 [Patescibacteria group bacterium]